MSAREYKFNILGWVVKTMVVSNAFELTDGLTELLSSLSMTNKRAVGLDIESSYDAYTNHDKVVLLKLSTDNFCLLIRLCNFPKPLNGEAINALVNFLGLIDVSFVGVGVKFCLELLKRDYGLSCRNQVDLGQLAAAVYKRPKLAYLGLTNLAKAVLDYGAIPSVASRVVLSDWRAVELTSDQIKSATTGAFVSFLIGKRLL